MSITMEDLQKELAKQDAWTQEICVINRYVEDVRMDLIHGKAQLPSFQDPPSQATASPSSSLFFKWLAVVCVILVTLVAFGCTVSLAYDAASVSAATSAVTTVDALVDPFMDTRLMYMGSSSSLLRMDSIEHLALLNAKIEQEMRIVSMFGTFGIPYAKEMIVGTEFGRKLVITMVTPAAFDEQQLLLAPNSTMANYSSDSSTSDMNSTFVFHWNNSSGSNCTCIFSRRGNRHNITSAQGCVCQSHATSADCERRDTGTLIDRFLMPTVFVYAIKLLCNYKRI